MWLSVCCWLMVCDLCVVVIMLLIVLFVMYRMWLFFVMVIVILLLYMGNLVVCCCRCMMVKLVLLCFDVMMRFVSVVVLSLSCVVCDVMKLCVVVVGVVVVFLVW